MSSQKEWVTQEKWRELSDLLARRPLRSTTVLLLVADLALIAGSWWLKLRGGLAAQLGAWALLTFSLTQLYLILHEATHGAVSRRKWLNNFAGHVSGWLFLYPFLTRQRNHMMHHVWTAHPTGDPANQKLISKFSVMTQKEADKLEFVWKYWLPVIALNDLVGTWRDPFRSQDPMKPSPRLAREIRVSKGYLLGYALLGVLLLATGKLGAFLGWFLPPWILFLCAVELLNLPHHAEAPLLDASAGPPPYWKQAELSHNCGSLPVWSSFVIMNFNLHIAHHAFPRVPWYDLPRANRMVEEAAASEKQTFKNEFEWAAIHRRKPLLQLMGHFFDKRAPASAVTSPPLAEEAQPTAGG